MGTETSGRIEHGVQFHWLIFSRGKEGKSTKLSVPCAVISNEFLFLLSTELGVFT